MDSNVFYMSTQFVSAPNTIYNFYIDERKGAALMAINNVSNENAIIEDLLSLTDGNLDNLVHITTAGYSDIVQVFGWKMAMEMYVYFRGSTINCAMSFFKKEYVVEVASKCPDKRERERIARICGYASQIYF